MAQYKPHADSLVAKVLEHLLAAGSPVRPNAITRAQVVQMFEAVSSQVVQSLAPAVKAGLLAVNRDGEDPVYYLPPPPGGPLQITIKSDGHVTVAGGQPAEDGSVMFTSEQMQQLVVQVTRPFVALPFSPTN